MTADINVAQFSDCHLFADKNALHYGANVYQNLLRVLTDLAKDKSLKAIIFTGDLSQDHSEQSYQNFVDAVSYCRITTPIYYLAGNHDQVTLLNKYLVNDPFTKQKIIESEHWQVLLVNSKSDTPAGIFDHQALNFISDNINPNKAQLLFSHHHPIDVGYFIDKHGLKNQQKLWQTVSNYPSIKALACGHVHRALTLAKQLADREVKILTCPATSIQFDPSVDTVKALPKTSDQGVGYRRFSLCAKGELTTEVHFCQLSN